MIKVDISSHSNLDGRYERCRGKQRILPHTIRSMIYAAVFGLGCLSTFGSGAETTREDTVVVTEPWPDQPPAPDPYDIDYGNGNDQGGSGGSEDQGNQDNADIPCEVLLSTKPANCPNPIDTPSGYTYGRDEYASGSAIAKLIAYSENPANNESARFNVRAALDSQTRMIAERIHPVDEIQSAFFNLISVACHLESRAWDGKRFGVELTTPERMCLDAMGKAQAEADKSTTSFIEFFSRWLDKEGLNIGDLVPQTVVNLFSPQNSMTKKYELVTEDAKCATWWKQVKHNQCPAG